MLHCVYGGGARAAFLVHNAAAQAQFSHECILVTVMWSDNDQVAGY